MIELYTKRVSPATGEPYPRCRFVSSGNQCDRVVYSQGLCWSDWQKQSGDFKRSKINYGEEADNQRDTTRRSSVR